MRVVASRLPSWCGIETISGFAIWIVVSHRCLRRCRPRTATSGLTGCSEARRRQHSLVLRCPLGELSFQTVEPLVQPQHLQRGAGDRAKQNAKTEPGELPAD